MSDIIDVEFKRRKPAAKKVVPLVLLLLVIIADQVTKLLVVKNIPMFTVGAQFFDGFINFIHVANPGIAFSIGQGWSVLARGILFRLIPLVVIILVLMVYVRNDDFTQLQRWAISGIAGGGFGNLIDRFFRKEGVVDFIDVKWFGISESPLSFLRWERWPTFNVADAAVVVCGILLLISFLVTVKKTKGEA